MLCHAGFNVVSIRSADTEADRAAAVARFNDAASDAQVFVISIALSGFGLNLHHCCRTGFLLGYHWNVGNIRQVMGRLIRLGQKNRVTWHLINVAGSFADLQRSRAYRRWARQLAAESCIPDHVGGKMRLACAYELIRAYFNERCNRYGWEAQLPKTSRDFDSDAQVMAGRMYSAIARACLRLDEKRYARYFRPLEGMIDQLPFEAPDLRDMHEEGRYWTPELIHATAMQLRQGEGAESLERRMEDRRRELLATLRLDEDDGTAVRVPLEDPLKSLPTGRASARRRWLADLMQGDAGSDAEGDRSEDEGAGSEDDDSDGESEEDGETDGGTDDDGDGAAGRRRAGPKHVRSAEVKMGDSSASASEAEAEADAEADADTTSSDGSDEGDRRGQKRPRVAPASGGGPESDSDSDSDSGSRKSNSEKSTEDTEMDDASWG